jgi:hypothetical protein
MRMVSLAHIVLVTHGRVLLRLRRWLMHRLLLGHLLHCVAAGSIWMIDLCLNLLLTFLFAIWSLQRICRHVA